MRTSSTWSTSSSSCRRCFSYSTRCVCPLSFESLLSLADHSPSRFLPSANDQPSLLERFLIPALSPSPHLISLRLRSITLSNDQLLSIASVSQTSFLYFLVLFFYGDRSRPRPFPFQPISRCLHVRLSLCASFSFYLFSMIPLSLLLPALVERQPSFIFVAPFLFVYSSHSLVLLIPSSAYVHLLILPSSHSDSLPALYDILSFLAFFQMTWLKAPLVSHA